jgi:2-dehydropantoate 2-reductase
MSEFDVNKVAVIGAGAMGSLFGGLLCEGGLDVTLLDVNAEHVAEIRKNGLKITGFGGDRCVKSIRATTDPSEIGRADVVLVQCKARVTREAVRSASEIFGDTTVAISFQNGVGNEEIIAEVVGENRVLGGETAQGSGMVGPGIIRHAGDLPSHIGEMAGGISDRVSSIANAFTAAGLNTIASENINKDIWKKLMANVAINPISALCNFYVGEIYDVPETKETILEAIEEAYKVAVAEGIELDIDETKSVLDNITGKGGTSTNRSGMLVDVLNERKTEIDFINGAIVRLGKKHGIPTPVNKTLVAAVKGKERNFD